MYLTTEDSWSSSGSKTKLGAGSKLLKLCSDFTRYKRCAISRLVRPWGYLAKWLFCGQAERRRLEVINVLDGCLH